MLSTKERMKNSIGENEMKMDFQNTPQVIDDEMKRIKGTFEHRSRDFH